jgi:tRNA A-37 threonylcarbamoyl transferase component Bud32
MKPEVTTLFGELSGLPREERERYYTAHSVPEELRGEVESLLSFDSGRPIQDIIDRAAGLVFRDPVSDGDYCGPFQLLRLIGRGGMGVVYLAERVDGEVRQRVAVKLLRGALDSSAARQRFLQERQILASLAHPNIARLIDAGHRADGHPYLVMEFVEGKRIDEYSSNLPVREKVALMAMVCDAIAAAHQQLVVHRDLKPANILVDASGNPRVVDFGIAKLMDEPDATMTVERQLTPDYASPEQIAGTSIATATDIYSLGAVLYKLLTGAAPVRGMLAPPSRVCPAARGDLDAIVLKTLRVEPHERYATADKLAEDLRAWLEHRPVAARYGEHWYRARRHLRRHWALVSAGVIAAAGLIIGLLVARSERDIAQQRFQQVRQLANEFFDVEKDIQGMPGSTAVRERIVNTSIQYLEALSKRAGNDWRLKLEIAAGYRRAAEAQGIARGMNLGRPADAQESLNKAAVLLAEARAAAPEDRHVQHDLIEVLELQSRIEYGSRNLKALDTKLAELQRSLSSYEASAKDEPAEWQFIGRIYESMAVSARELSRMELPMTFARRAVALQRKVAGGDKSFAARGRLANALSAYAGLLRATGDLRGAVDTLQESLTVLEGMAAENPDHYTTQLNIANNHALIGRNLGDPVGPSLRQTQAAVQHLQESLRIGRRLMRLDPNDTQIRFNHAVAAWRLGDALRDQDAGSALSAYDEGIGILRLMSGERFSRDIPLVATLVQSTYALRALGRDRQAVPRLQEAAAICREYQGRSAVLYETCSEYTSRAEAERALANGRPRDAVVIHRDWLQLTDNEARMKEASEDIYSAYVLTRRYRLLTNALVAAGMKAEAEQAELTRRGVIESWKKKLAGRDDAEVLLSR